MDLPNSSTAVKFEASVDTFPSVEALGLYSPTSPTSPNATVNPLEVLTPKPISADDNLDSPVSCGHDQSPAPTDGTDKKPTKKRKSWGQVLPEPKTNLPPRKRAKTEDEKEQRRVERVLRNRRAAQSSRERKRLEVEALEKSNKQLQLALIYAQKQNVALAQKLHSLQSSSGPVTRSPSPLNSLRDNPVTLSQQLFGSQDDDTRLSSEQVADLVGELIRSSANPTVNPASLSPELAPVSDLASAVLPTTEAQAGLRTGDTSSDLTQRPAEMLCDLPCHTSGEVSSSPATLIPRSHLWAWSLHLRMLLLSASALLWACHRPLTQIALSSKAAFSLHQTPQLLATIIWLVTLPTANSNSSTSTNFSPKTRPLSSLTLWQRAMMPPPRTTTRSTKLTTLRFKSLRKILSSSPSLARPLMDATMEALRLVSEGRDDRAETWRAEPRGSRGAVACLTQCLRDVGLPSREVLLTLLWVLVLEERKIQRGSEGNNRSEKSILVEQSTQKYVLKVMGTGRGSERLVTSFDRRRHLA